MTDDIVKRLRGLADCDARSGEPLGKCMREAADEIERMRGQTPKWNKIESIPKNRPSLVQTKHGVTIQVLPTKEGGFIEEWNGKRVAVHDFYAWREIIKSKELGNLK